MFKGCTRDSYQINHGPLWRCCHLRCHPFKHFIYSPGKYLACSEASGKRKWMQPSYLASLFSWAQLIFPGVEREEKQEEAAKPRRKEGKVLGGINPEIITNKRNTTRFNWMSEGNKNRSTFGASLDKAESASEISAFNLAGNISWISTSSQAFKQNYLRCIRELKCRWELNYKYLVLWQSPHSNSP